MKLNLDLEPKISKDVFLVQLGDLARRKVMKVFDKIIDTDISVGESVGRGSIKSQLRMANKAHAKLALIIGQKEALDNTVIVRDMKSGMQETVIMNEIVKEVRRMLSK
ncbi:MAG: His/Gly/Thr/Pro-type tRNA ligase C-terminal domain-containing protein, partial [Candidatus Paceibacterota bacterium]